MTDSALLAGQAALVTGASSGLGDRFARTLAAAGARVVVAARRRERLDDLVAGIRASGGIAHAIALDVADPARIPAAVAEAEAALGPISILVNNAGTATALPAIENGLEEIDTMLAVNVRAPFLLAIEVAKRLIARGAPGRIVNISSIGAFNFDGRIPCAFYVTTKSAVVRMTEALAVEWAPHHINVNAIAPGLFRSEMSAPMLERGEQKVVQRLTRGRIGEPDGLDSTLLYLVAPSSEYVTGTCIRVDDGQMPR